MIFYLEHLLGSKGVPHVFSFFASFSSFIFLHQRCTFHLLHFIFTFISGELSADQKDTPNTLCFFLITF
jgi:hypothetical protein